MITHLSVDTPFRCLSFGYIVHQSCFTSPRITSVAPHNSDLDLNSTVSKTDTCIELPGILVWARRAYRDLRRCRNPRKVAREPNIRESLALLDATPSKSTISVSTTFKNSEGIPGSTVNINRKPCHVHGLLLLRNIITKVVLQVAVCPTQFVRQSPKNVINISSEVTFAFQGDRTVTYRMGVR